MKGTPRRLHERKRYPRCGRCHGIRGRRGWPRIQEVVKRGVVPAGVVRVRDSLQRGDRLLGDFGHAFLICRVAEVDTTAKRACFARGAKTIDLKRAAIPRHRLLVRRRAFQQNLGLECADEERVAVLGEATAAPGRIAARVAAYTRTTAASGRRDTPRSTSSTSRTRLVMVISSPASRHGSRAGSRSGSHQRQRRGPSPSCPVRCRPPAYPRGTLSSRPHGHVSSPPQWG